MARSGQPDVAVVGAGIVGLYTALTLARAGRRVVVVSADEPRDTVSAVAGGLWSPFHVGPPEAVARWSRIGYDAYAELAAGTPEAGVRMVDATVVVADDSMPLDWEVFAPPGAGRPARADERPPGVRAARVMTVPLADTARHLLWLGEQLAATGVTVVRRRLDALADAFDLAAVVVGCVGFAGRELLEDAEVAAIRGVVIEVGFAGSAELVPVLDDTGPQPTYVLPRLDGTVLLGGRVDHGDERRTAASAEVTDILARCAALVPRVGGAPVRQTKAGLRPGRSDVRVEELHHPDGRLVVNYGHGGSGWTLAAGCSRDVAAIVAGGGAG